MTLIASISGIRGTIGGKPGENLTPLDIARFTAAYGAWLTLKNDNRTVVLGRDARPSGAMVHAIVSGVLVGLGFKVIDLGISTTPTVELAVPAYKAAGGIILTASHNPVEWNALKLLNHRGEFITQKDGMEVLEFLENEYYTFSDVRSLGFVTQDPDFLKEHIRKILALPLVDKFAIERANLKIVVDGINSSGGIAVPELLQSLGVKNVVKLNCDPTGWFVHDPEPLEKNLTGICTYIRNHKADLGIIVDPDVDRLVFVDNEGNLFGEEYTLVAVADYVLQHQKSPVVSNLSSSRALRDVAARHGCSYYASAVGEVNVIEIMKRKDAVIGGEGNGGIIFPELHYGRDALVGIALFLSHLTKSGLSARELRSTYPDYYMSKQKLELPAPAVAEAILEGFYEKHRDRKVNTADGIKVDFEHAWVHLRKSNTEPIIRVYTEASTQSEADELANQVLADLRTMKVV